MFNVGEYYFVTDDVIIHIRTTFDKKSGMYGEKGRMYVDKIHKGSLKKDEEWAVYDLSLYRKATEADWMIAIMKGYHVD